MSVDTIRLRDGCVGHRVLTEHWHGDCVYLLADDAMSGVASDALSECSGWG